MNIYFSSYILRINFPITTKFVTATARILGLFSPKQFEQPIRDCNTKLVPNLLNKTEYLLFSISYILKINLPVITKLITPVDGILRLFSPKRLE